MSVHDKYIGVRNAPQLPESVIKTLIQLDRGYSAVPHLLTSKYTDEDSVLKIIVYKRTIVMDVVQLNSFVHKKEDYVFIDLETLQEFLLMYHINTQSAIDLLRGLIDEH